MSRVFEVLLGRVTNVGATITAVTMGAGDSLTVRSAPDGPIWLENVWAAEATAGILQIRSPRLHDNVRGLRWRIPANNNIRGLLADEMRQRLYSQDTLIVELSGGAAETDVVALLLQYEQIGGGTSRFATWDQVQPRVVNYVTQEVSCTASATAGDWGGGQAISANFDLLEANTDYAVLGYEVDSGVLAVTIRGADTGNYRIGGPGTAEPLETRDWFTTLSEGIKAPAIPVINSANKSNTFVTIAAQTASATANVNLILAQLSPGSL